MRIIPNHDFTPGRSPALCAKCDLPPAHPIHERKPILRGDAIPTVLK